MKKNSFVIDTNILMSAFLLKHSPTTLAYEKAKQSGSIVASKETYNEFCDVFVRSKFDKYISLPKRLTIINELRNVLAFIKTHETITDCRDPKDNKFLELAVSANAACIITGDNDLLVLHPYRTIAIINASYFVNHFAV